MSEPIEITEDLALDNDEIVTIEYKKGNEERVFELRRGVINISQLLSTLFKETDSTKITIDELPSFNVEGLEKAMEYIKHYDGKELPPLPEKPLISCDLKDSFPEWEVNFINCYEDQNVDDRVESLANVLMAAHFFHIPNLLDLVCGKMAVMLKTKLIEIEKLTGEKKE